MDFTRETFAAQLEGQAQSRFSKMSPSHQKEWLRYINEAKKDQTKLRRIEKMQQDLLKD
ncbi:YdeI/OmpD-associated family protein [Streptococcus oricebi]|uniref:Bacteriocin n=1 Tax=Streptococcus oricebi TaxID=1547447 RepID=A0ABS5B479_9STRE|nr:YdeI/OmpD-associated family protein [Streptococcus oricebi]MBP2623633.1 bacteriocin [Streptococcus oricebi]